MERNPINAFSFIGEELKSSENMNELFIAGYRDKVCTDYTHSLAVDELKQDINYNNPSDLHIDWMDDIIMADNKSLGDSVMQYLTDNITDLTINTLILFMQQLGMPIRLIDHYVANMLKQDNNIRNQIIDIISSMHFPVSRNYPDFALFQVLDTSMSSVHAKVVSFIFENFIDTIAASALSETGIEQFYEMIYKMVYDDEVIETSYSNMYNLCMGTMREILDHNTMNYRLGLMQIASNAVSMICGSPRFGQEVINPKYITSNKEFLDNSGLYLKSAFKSTEEIKDDNC